MLVTEKTGRRGPATDRTAARIETFCLGGNMYEIDSLNADGVIVRVEITAGKANALKIDAELEKAAGIEKPKKKVAAKKAPAKRAKKEAEK